MRLLLVEDDPAITRFLVKGLREEQHFVDVAESGLDGEELAGATTYDAILLDLMLPGIDGFELCRRLRHRQVDTPILMITARDAVSDRVQGLDVGADDYLTKPFAFDELLARLRALTRRGRTHQMDGRPTCGPIVVDPQEHVAMVNGTRVPLSATEFRLLEFLVRRGGSIVSRDQLAEHVWGGDYDPASNLADVYIGYLRRKLQPLGAGQLIRTVRGLGYMLKGGED